MTLSLAMNNTDPLLLSFCIPTYSQPYEVDRLLLRLLPQVLPGMEVVICDDSPSDATEVIVRKYEKSFSIRYFKKNPMFAAGQSGGPRKKGEKGGLDRAIIFLTQEARGKYVWWFGDDVLNDGAIVKVIETVRRWPEISFLFVNFQNVVTGELPYQFGGDKPFRDANQVLEDIGGGGLGYISAVIFERAKAVSGLEASKKYIGSAYVNLYIVLHVLSQSGRLYYLEGPHFMSYPNPPEKMNDDGFEVFGVNLFHVVMSFSHAFRRKSIRTMLARNFHHVWRGVLVRWVTGYESPSGKRWPMFRLYWNFSEFWVAIPLLLLPLSVNRFLYRIYKNLKER